MDSVSEYRSEVGEVMDYIRHIFKALRVSSSQFEKELGLSAAQIFVMKKLKKEPGLSINDLALRTTTHQSSVSVVVKKLEEQGLVSRMISKEDSRKVVVSLTSSGLEKLNEIPRTIQEEMLDALQKMNPEKTAVLAQVMKEFVSNAGIIEGTPAPMIGEIQRGEKS
ncbi:MarR family transcriptional regulator [Bdellovibrio bacteriovorus]|uniref:MarR family winged helix-turn-helix transcriptional regulator n=1 Tax=Bdellovibrio bacteriovorus TaxID=959 RepID=UPI0021CF29CF|nr:MarR family transcriptional regulator [Bdellovibrio bacteriovorus]UXR63906.1 MarR family transcriptional regulator [Bdellovibrio bacteriovorus]